MKISALKTEKDGPFTVKYHLPGGTQPSAILAHSYCMTWNKEELAPPTQAVVEEAIRMKQEIGDKVKLVLSNAYPDLSEEEKAMKEAMLREAEIALNDVTFIEINNTYDEIEGINRVLEGVQKKVFMVIADQYHMPRSLQAIQAGMDGDAEIYWKSVAPKNYKITREIFPNASAKEKVIGAIKSIRLGFKSLWIIWNRLLMIRPPK